MAQPHRGDRVAILARPPKPVADEIKRLARAHGVSINDFVAHHLAELVGMPDLAPPLGAADDDALMSRGDVALRPSA